MIPCKTNVIFTGFIRCLYLEHFNPINFALIYSCKINYNKTNLLMWVQYLNPIQFFV